MRSISTAYPTGSSMRVPPSCAYSATTPASRAATASRKRGGHDHSRPTSRPTFFGGIGSFLFKSLNHRDTEAQRRQKNAEKTGFFLSWFFFSVPLCLCGSTLFSSTLVVALGEALEPAEGVLDDLAAGGLERGAGLELGGVERGEVLLVPTADGGKARRGGVVALAEQRQHLDGRHQDALAVLGRRDPLVVVDHLADVGHQPGDQHRQVVARTLIAEVVFRPVAHAAPLLGSGQSCPPMYSGSMRAQTGQSCAKPSQTRSACQTPLPHSNSERR